MSLSSDHPAENDAQEISELPATPVIGKKRGFSLKKNHKEPHESKAGTIVTRPGIDPATWERWLLAPECKPELLAPEAPVPSRCEHLLILPSSTLFAWPLWIAADGEVLDLVRLELSGRHLLKRGMDDSLVITPILRREDRQLLLAVATDEPFPTEAMPPDWKRSARFELPARLLAGSLQNDLILWEEWGALQMAFYRDSKPVWFCNVRPQELAGLIHRLSLRLLSESVLEHLPRKIHLDGIRNELAERFISELRNAFPTAEITQQFLSAEGTAAAPLLRDDPFDLAPTEARHERTKLKKRQQMLSFAAAAALLYLLLLIWGAGYLFIRQTALKRLQTNLVQMQAPALNAQEESDRWKTFRPVIDPSTYALDLLSAVAAPTQGGKIRLTLYSLEQGALHIAGEATDVTQAYNFIEQLKKNPLLQEYNWNAGQPQIAGKDSVKFDIEGTLIDAPHETPGS